MKISITEILKVVLFESQINEETKNINIEEAIRLVKASNGAIFTVLFTKKDGSDRLMNARLGVKKHLRGGDLPYDPVAKGLLPVFDMQIKQYRMISLSKIKNVKINNNIYNVV